MRPTIWSGSVASTSSAICQLAPKASPSEMARQKMSCSSCPSDAPSTPFTCSTSEEAKRVRRRSRAAGSVGLLGPTDLGRVLGELRRQSAGRVLLPEPTQRHGTG